MPSSTKSKVCFFFPAPVRLERRTELKQFIISIFRKENTRLASINYIFCSDQELLQINRDHLAHDYYTDIITFGLSAPGAPVDAEIYISVDRVRENAIDHGEPFYRELQRVIFHGALHLCGYKDKLPREVKTMRQKEEFYLNLYSSK